MHLILQALVPNMKIFVEEHFLQESLILNSIWRWPEALKMSIYTLIIAHKHY